VGGGGKGNTALIINHIMDEGSVVYVILVALSTSLATIIITSGVFKGVVLGLQPPLNCFSSSIHY